MNYKCKKCGTEFVVEEKMKVCSVCGLEISAENDANKITKPAMEKLEGVIKKYEETGDSGEVKTTIAEWDKYASLPDFNRVWRSFVLSSAGVAVAKKDKELQPVIKNHARDFDANREESDLFLTLLKTHPKLGTINDWEELIQRTHGDETKFGVICDSIIYCINKGKNKSFAVEIFYLFYSHRDEWASAGRKYIRALLSSDDIANDVFPVSAFNGSMCKFATKLKAYCKSYLEGDHSIALEQTKVWENYLVAYNQRKKRAMIALSITAGVIVAVAIGIAIFLSSVNRQTVEFTVDKVIEVTYGDEPREFLKNYFVTYQKNSGATVTETIENKMIGYDPEKLGEQTVQFEFKGTSVSVTLIVKKLQLDAPVLTQVGSYIRWEAVPHAQYYAIYVNATVAETLKTTELSYDVSSNENHGELKITVRALTDDTKYEASSFSEPLTVTKLEAPRDIVYMNGKLSWSGVEGASTYELTINGTPYTVSVPECVVEFIQGDNEVTINAKGDNDSVIYSVTSKTIFYGRLNPITGMYYQNGNVYWNADESAKSFAVYVDGTYWKDFSRSYFSVTGDGFADAFSSSTHEIGIVCKTAVMGIEPSEMKSYQVAIGNHIKIDEGNIRWDSIGQGATYFVKVNGKELTLADAYVPMSECEWSVGNNTVSVSARLCGIEYICETATIIKLSAPTISISDGGWTTDNNQNNLYSVDNGAWSSTLPDVASLTAGDHTIRAKRAISSTDALEIESDEIEIKIMRPSAPTIYVIGGAVKCTYDASSYALKLFYAEKGSDNWIAISTADEIVNTGEYKLRASLTPRSDKFSSYDGLLSSAYSTVIEATKPGAPSVIYNKDSHTLTSDTAGAKFYYLDNNGEEHEVVGGNTSNLPGGVFTIYARLNSVTDGILNSANTPEHLRVSVFNLDIDMSVTVSGQNTCNVSFDGCEEIDELVFTYKFEYYDSNGILVGGLDRTGETPVTITRKTADGKTMWTQLTYYHYQLSTGSYNDIKTIKLIVNITFDTETLVREATTNK